MCPGPVVLDGSSVTLETNRIQGIVTILELYDTTDRIPHTEIIVGAQILQSLHQSTSHVSSFGSLDGRIDQTFTTGNGVKEEFGRRKTGIERVSDETFGRGVFGFLAEMRQ
jgi:hypothetical protein